MKRYVITVEIEEGSDEFWEGLSGKTGCDEVTAEVRAALDERGFSPGYGTTVKLTNFVGD